MSNAALEEPAAPPANESPATPPAEPPATPPAAVTPAPAPKAPPKTVATAAAEPPPAPDKPYWPEDWRAKIAGTDDKRNPLRRTLETFQDPAAVFNSMQELRRRWDEGGHVKIPGEKATDDEVASFRKALNVPEKPEGYIDHLKLANDAVLGDADKPMVLDFAGRLHKVHATPAVVNEAVNWWYEKQEADAAALDEADETFRLESERRLREEQGLTGPKLQRYRNAFERLFRDYAPTGLYERMFEGRLGDGRLLGNDPDVIWMMKNLADQLVPYATVTEDGNQQGQGVDDEIAKIEKFMRTNRNEYFRDEKMQARYRELTDARERNKARSAA